MKNKDASFTSLQDSEKKLCCFLDCLLDTIDLHNSNLQQKATKAPSQQLDHAVQALSCVTPLSRDRSYGPSRCKQNWDYPPVPYTANI